MIKVLYIFPKDAPLIRQHVELLAEGLRQSVEICMADSYKVFKQQLKLQQPDPCCLVWSQSWCANRDNPARADRTVGC